MWCLRGRKASGCPLASFVGKAEAAELITAFWAAGGDRLDTARIYADEPGLGEVLARCPKDTLTPLDSSWTFTPHSDHSLLPFSPYP